MRAHSITAVAAVSLLALSCASASAQDYTDRPFIDATLVQSQARALELADLRLTLAETFPGETDDDFLEQIESLQGDFARFGGTLAAADADLAQSLEAALQDVAEAVESGEDAAEDIAEARTLLGEAYDVVIDPAIQDTAAFKGAVLTDLLLGEPGVAEGYEEAGEEPWAFSMGWAALQRVKELWGEVSAQADETHRSDGDEMIATIDPLFPNGEPPERFVGNPEEAEASAQRFVGIIETVVSADLYPGRDHAALAAHLAELTTPACEVYASGDEVVADETIYAVAGLYTDNLAELTNLFAPETAEEVSDLLASLVEVEDEDEGGAAGEGAEQSDETAGDDDDDAASLAPAESCEALAEQLRQVGMILGG